MRTLMGLVLVATVAVGACGSDDSTTHPPSTDTSAVAPAANSLDADTALIVALCRGLSDTWSTGTEAGVRAEIEHAYPGLGNDLDECLSDVPPDTHVEYVIDQSTIERDDAWLVPGGPLAGQHPQGSVYIMQVQITQGGSTTASEIHAAVREGVAYGFPRCSL